MEEKKITDKKEVENVSIEISQKKKQAVLLPSYTKIYSQTRIESTTLDYTWQIDRFFHLTRSIDMLCSSLFPETADYKIQINVERTALPVIKFYLLATKAFTGSCTITLTFPHQPNLSVKSVWGYISGQTLLTEITNDYFTSIYGKVSSTDTLTIRCKFEIFYKQISDTMHVNLQSSTMFSKDMRSLKDSTLDESANELEDEKSIKFIIGDEKYVISKKLLHATNSSYFKNICFTHEEKDITNELTASELPAFKEMLIFIITGSITSNKLGYKVNNIMFTKLLTTADKYDVPTLKLTCEHYLIRDITLDNVVDLIQLAFWHNAELLKTHSVAFIKFNMKEVMNTKKFQDLPQESANKIMELIDKTKVLEKSNDQFLSSGPRDLPNYI